MGEAEQEKNMIILDLSLEKYQQVKTASFVNIITREKRKFKIRQIIIRCKV